MEFAGLSKFPSRLKVIFTLKLLTIVSTVIAVAYEPTSLSRQEKVWVKNITPGTDKFTLSLYRALTNNNKGNALVSPLSAGIVLGLAYTGAKNQTAKELATLLELPGSIEETYYYYKSLIKDLQTPALNIATGMFVGDDARIKDDFQKNAKEFFQALVKTLQFHIAPDKSREYINSWVENQTNKKITNLLPGESIKTDTKLVLVNAIYFKDNWHLKFDKKNTKKELFHVSKARTVQVQMMHNKGLYLYAYDEKLKSKVLQLDYEGSNTGMVIILPDDTEGLVELEAKLDKVKLFEKIRYLKNRTVIVAIPKFKMEVTMKLNEILKSLGAKSMFDLNKADFGGLSDRPLAVSDVVQKTFIEVNENGTEAAAATSTGFYSKSRRPPPLTFVADHPFLFIITHKNKCIFIGRMMEPSHN